MFNKRKFIDTLIFSSSLIISFTVLSLSINTAINTFKQYDRTVVVKGLSERQVNADVVTWSIQFQAVGNSITEVYKVLEENLKLLKQFLKNNNISNEEITIYPPSIEDKAAFSFNKDNPLYRFIGYYKIIVYSKNPTKIRTALFKSSILTKQGLILSKNIYDNKVSYEFTQLNKIKPEMIKEATNNARKVAEQFAQDSKSKLSKIKYASQGKFSINDRDKNTSFIKKIRVVSTIEYYLTD